ncbi:Uncharacterised protein [uncultured archaeon]|nr:Uncharacterised protein [uncultured archaeon]
MKETYSATMAGILLVTMISGCLSGTTPTEKTKSDKLENSGFTQIYNMKGGIT